MENRKYMQFDLFTWEAEQTGDGHKRLMAHEFEQAAGLFKEVLERYPDNKTALSGCITAMHWSKVFEQCSGFTTIDDTELLYMAIEDFDFEGHDAPENFRRSLLRKLIALMKQNGMFFIQPPVAISDLYASLGEYDSAIHILAERLNLAESAGSPDQGMLRCRLANVQYLAGETADARRNYTIALLYEPGQIDKASVTYKELRELIGRTGAGVAAAYACIEGLLPLLHVSSPGIKSLLPKDNPSRKLYKLLYAAETARKNRSPEIPKTRMNLKAADPEFYDAYFRWIEKMK